MVFGQKPRAVEEKNEGMISTCSAQRTGKDSSEVSSIWVKITLFANLVLTSFTLLGRSLSPASNEKPSGAGIIWSGYSVL